MIRSICYIAYVLALVSCSNQNPQEPINSSTALDSLQGNSSEIVQLIDPYKTKLDSSMNVVIGNASIELKNEYKRGESSLGNFVSDLMYFQANKMHSDSVHFSLINAHGGLRVPMSKGEITVRDIYELMPFDNEVLVLSVNGKEVEQIIQHTAADCRNVLTPIRFEIKENVANSILLGGSKVDTSKTYNLAISDYLANGGGGFDFLKDNDRIVLGVKLRDMIIQHIVELTAQGISVYSELDGRIKMEHVR